MKYKVRFFVHHSYNPIVIPEREWKLHNIAGFICCVILRIAGVCETMFSLSSQMCSKPALITHQMPYSFRQTHKESVLLFVSSTFYCRCHIMIWFETVETVSCLSIRMIKTNYITILFVLLSLCLLHTLFFFTWESYGSHISECRLVSINQ